MRAGPDPDKGHAGPGRQALSARGVKIALGLLVVAGFAAAGWFFWGPDTQSLDLSRARLDAWIDRAGFWGPLLIIVLMTGAIVFTPIPSAPIALAAGGAYGHFWGTVYVLIGAESGAIVAFFLARILGYRIVRRWFGETIDVGLLGSQNALMVTVFITRILPFISFDIISYAAGLSRLSFWRFALATLAGILPASFFLAHFGSELSTADPGRMAWAVLGLGLITGIPIAIAAWRNRFSGGQ